MFYVKQENIRYRLVIIIQSGYCTSQKYQTNFSDKWILATSTTFIGNSTEDVVFNSSTSDMFSQNKSITATKLL